MEATHHRTGDKALLSYNVSKAPELSDPVDLNSAPDRQHHLHPERDLRDARWCGWCGRPLPDVGIELEGLSRHPQMDREMQGHGTAGGSDHQLALVDVGWRGRFVVPNYFQEQCLDRRLLAMTREIVHSRTLPIPFFGSLEKVVNLFVSSLCTQSALNLEHKAEEALILFLCATKPTSDITCRVNWDFWITASLPVHCILLNTSFSATG